MRTASWMIVEKGTGILVCETFDEKKVAALNTERYKAVPAYDYLVNMNKQLKQYEVYL